MLRGANRATNLVFAIASLVVAATPAIGAGCKLGRIVEFPITMVGLRPLLTAKINDVDVQFVVDSGAFYSMITAASAAQLKLRTAPAPFGFSATGVHGSADVSIATVKTFVLAGVPLNNVDFLVGGSEPGQGSVGLLGENFLHIGDVEYDLGQGTVRLMNAQGCGKAMLGYWVGPSTPYSVIDIAMESQLNDSTGSHFTHNRPKLSPPISHAYLNGAEIRVAFDTGAPTSILSLEAAARAGIKPDSPGVINGGTSFGIGRESFVTYIAPVASYKIGEEEIKNTRLRIGDIKLPSADMLIGTDFFLRKHQTSAGDADIGQASAIWPSVAEEFKRRGIEP